jgi:hypothetical protein
VIQVHDSESALNRPGEDDNISTRPHRYICQQIPNSQTYFITSNIAAEILPLQWNSNNMKQLEVEDGYSFEFPLTSWEPNYLLGASVDVTNSIVTLNIDGESINNPSAVVMVLLTDGRLCMFAYIDAHGMNYKNMCVCLVEY